MPLFFHSDILHCQQYQKMCGCCSKKKKKKEKKKEKKKKRKKKSGFYFDPPTHGLTLPAGTDGNSQLQKHTRSQPITCHHTNPVPATTPYHSTQAVAVAGVTGLADVEYRGTTHTRTHAHRENLDPFIHNLSQGGRTLAQLDYYLLGVFCICPTV